MICSSFVAIAKREIDRGGHGLAKSIIAQAEEVYAEAGQLVAAAEMGDEKQRLEWKLLDLRSRLDILEGQMKRLKSNRRNPTRTTVQ
jgi:hypothetical protein